jgi:GntR family transcriptional regulator
MFAPGVRLPGERVLAAQLSVSRETLRQALKQLAADGVLHAFPQRGWFVTTNTVSDPPNVLQSFTDMARARGLRPTSVVLHSATRPATLEEADRLSLAPTSPVLEVRRLRCLDEIPIAVGRTVVSLQRAKELDKVDLTDASLYALLESVCGIKVVRSEYSVRAAGAALDVADLLRLEPGAPVMVGDDITYDINDAPVLCGQVVYRGDAYEFRATLYRPNSPTRKTLPGHTPLN